MLEAQRKRELMERAESLAGQLAQGGVTRAELRPVLNALFLPPLSWPERFAAAGSLLEALPESWVSKRSGRTRPQLARVRGALRAVFRDRSSEQELAFLLGWTARLLQVRTVQAQRIRLGVEGVASGPRQFGERPGAGGEARVEAAGAGTAGAAAPGEIADAKAALASLAAVHEPSRPERGRPERRAGMKITVEVVRAEGRQFTLRDVETGQDNIVLKSSVPLPWAAGERRKVRVEKLGADGRVLKVKP